MGKNLFLFYLRSTFLGIFVLIEVNYPHLSQHATLTIFALIGIEFAISKSLKNSIAVKLTNVILIITIVICFGYIFTQTEPIFRSLWIGGQSLGNRAGIETALDHAIGLIGLILVLEATRRSVGSILPILALIFLGYAAIGPSLPSWLFPHKGYPLTRIVSQTFLSTQGVFGIALRVMFTYVFLFVMFGSILEKTGATGYIIDLARKIFRSTTGGPAKIAVISSGVMGSLSGSAVANTATTGTFTIPMMRSSGFDPEIAGGIEAAASSGGALMPPIMGAGAYMMLELIEPSVTYVMIIKSAIIPAILYYVSLLLIVHFYAKRISAKTNTNTTEIEITTSQRSSSISQGLLFLIAFGTLIVFLLMKFTPFRAVTLSMIATIACSFFSEHTRISFRDLIDALAKTAESGSTLITAASCVGIILGVVTLTGLGTKLPNALIPIAQHSRFLAFVVLMIATIILGLGLPSSVCYLLVATFVGPLLDRLQVPPLAAHLFIFYFGMMSMVTPPVALAAYTAAAIANADIMKTSFAAFRFSIIGFALPFAFVFNSELLLIGSELKNFMVIGNIILTFVTTIPLAAGLAGFGFSELKFWQRSLLIAMSLTIMIGSEIWIRSLSIAVIAVISFLNWRKRS